MLKYIYTFCCVLLWQVCALAQTIPAKPDIPRTVNDLVGVLSPNETAMLEKKLRQYMDSTSTQIILVTIPTVGDDAIEDVALKILRDWGVGQKDKGNGVVMLCAMNDRKIFIATGYGIEGALPDLICRRIIDNDIKPAFRQKQYYQGFDAATTTIIKRASGEFQGDPDLESGGGDAIFIILFMLILFFIIFRANRGNNTMVSRRGHTSWNGGGGWWMYGGGGGFDNRRGGGYDNNDNDSWGGGGGFDFGGGSGGGGGAGGDW
jgi:uncharacterized protein